MTYLTERNGGRIVEVPIEFRDRSLGRSKMSSRIVVEAFLLVTWWGIRDRIAGSAAARGPARATLRAWRSPSSPSPVRSWSRAERPAARPQPAAQRRHRLEHAGRRDRRHRRVAPRRPHARGRGGDRPRVTEWEGPLYEVRATAVEMGWVMRCEVHRALAFEGDLVVDDPDGIVVEAALRGRRRVLRVPRVCARRGCASRSPTGSSTAGARTTAASTPTTCSAPIARRAPGGAHLSAPDEP